MASFLGRFRRLTSSGSYLPVIDGLRFVAIGMVVVFHVEGYLTAKAPIEVRNSLDQLVHYICHLGHYGVQLFFVISGFILGLPFASTALAKAPRTSLKSYFLRRLTRLEPPYILNLTILALLLWFSGRHDWSTLGAHYLASLFYLHNALYDAPSLINSVAWSLEVEVQFYVLAPLLAKVFSIPSRAWRLGILWLCILGLGLLFPWTFPHVSLRLLTNLPYFLSGFLLCDIYLVSWTSEPAPLLMGDLVAGASVLGFLMMGKHEALMPVLLPPLLLLFIAAAFRATFLSRVLSYTLVAVVGGMCYTIYLYHYWVIMACGALAAPGLPSNYSLAILTAVPPFAAAVVLFCAIPYLLLERPCMDKDWPKKVMFALRRMD